MTALTKDKRSQQVFFCCHCILNQNAKLEGIAGWPGLITDVVKTLVDSGAGIFQIACPEMIYEGIGRFDKSVEQYDCAAFHEICEDIAKETADQMKNYLQWGYQIPAILSIDGSPSCGYNLTQTAPEWRGLVVGQNWQKVRYIKRQGILMSHLVEQMKKNGLEIPIIGVPEIPELGNLDQAIAQISKLVHHERR